MYVSILSLVDTYIFNNIQVAIKVALISGIMIINKYLLLRYVSIISLLLFREWVVGIVSKNIYNSYRQSLIIVCREVVV